MLIKPPCTNGLESEYQKDIKLVQQVNKQEQSLVENDYAYALVVVNSDGNYINQILDNIRTNQGLYNAYYNALYSAPYSGIGVDDTHYELCLVKILHNDLAKFEIVFNTSRSASVNIDEAGDLEDALKDDGIDAEVLMFDYSPGENTATLIVVRKHNNETHVYLTTDVINQHNFYECKFSENASIYDITSHINNLLHDNTENTLKHNVKELLTETGDYYIGCTVPNYYDIYELENVWTDMTNKKILFISNKELKNFWKYSITI